MQWMLAAIAVAAALCFDVPASQAYSGNGPRCAFIDIGIGNIFKDCHYGSVEECRPNVLAGNRGTCNPNPHWEPAASRPKGHRKRHIRHH